MTIDTRSARRAACVAGVVLATLGPTGGVLAQDIYKWVDPKGVTQYTNTPPPPGIAATVIRAAPGPSAEAASQARADAQRLIDETNRRAAERERVQARQQAEAEAERISAGVRLQQCASARQQLDVLAAGGPVFRHDERGEHVFLDDRARDAEIARLRGEVARTCSGAEAKPGERDAATRQRAEQAARFARCDAARDALGELVALGPRVPTWQIEQAREKAAALCGGTP